jgi:N-acetylmuramoyl-L-alanine amidase
MKYLETVRIPCHTVTVVMMKRLRLILESLGCVLLVACSSTPRWDSQLPSAGSQVAPYQLYREANLKIDLIPRGTHGRRVHRPMQARYITIHSTQNYTAGAEKHSLALKRGALRATKRKGGNRIGYLTWHFTVEDGLVVQHLPTNEQGEHADFDGPGNNYSIGIEMCEHRGNNLAQTIERTAKLTAYLMYTKRIPLSGVVPHYHWPRRGTSPLHKNCPHFLLDNGRPGRTWRWFLSRVQMHYNRLIPGPMVTT